ncbi:AAA family ATPase [Microcoleus vaginatus GB2-A3]|uniref:AAA family ATPase n=1 Tax=Microcoleus vaginatus TaxID=119532 RepID=UPI0032A5F002
MNISQQRLHKLEIEKIKNIRDLCISFDTKNVTAILGPNGYGKSTILHVLACCFQPANATQENYKFSNFFPPHPDNLWQGSKLKIVHTYRQGSQQYENVETIYSKIDRWTPIYARRPTRSVLYFGVDNCVPLIEAEKRNNAKIHYSTEEVSEKIINTILEKASFCLNRTYTAYTTNDTGRGKKFIGVKADGITYSALSMSAGEQKIFRLLEKIFRAEKYSLILIDELDLLLHDSAMNNLMKVVAARAAEENIQVVFTTHRESVIELSDLINIRHIYSSGEKTLCFNETKPDAIQRLTGKHPKLIEVFVEDDLAMAIVKKVTGKLGMSRHVSIQRFGAAINCFTMLAALLLRGEKCENSIFILDGDRYRTQAEQKKCLSRVLTGDDETAKSRREVGCEKIKSLKLPADTNPEKYIHSIIIGLNNTDNEEYNEIIEVAKEIISVDDDHKYVNLIIERLGWDRSVGLSKIIDLISSSNEWINYVADVKDWLESKKVVLEETV